MNGHRELLTSERHTDGHWHARYPSGLLTLCGLEVLATPSLGRRYAPTCGRCSKHARMFDRVDRSMPEWWKDE